MMPKTPVLNKKKRKNMSYQEQLDEHTISVKYVLLIHLTSLVAPLLFNDCYASISYLFYQTLDIEESFPVVIHSLILVYIPTIL